MMQDLVGIVRTESEMARALDGLAKLKARAAKVGVTGHREYNPGWNTAIDLGNLMIVSEAVARSALERRESRGAHFREDCPNKSEQEAKTNIVIRKGPDGKMQLIREPLPQMTAEHKQIIEQQK
jgi:succinate dehydrogenase / fumarate reductase, flavoprotein subunit